MRGWRGLANSRCARFSRAAWISCRRRLSQILIAAATPLQARVAFDQLEGTLTRRIAALDAELFDPIARLEASLDFPEDITSSRLKKCGGASPLLRHASTSC